MSEEFKQELLKRKIQLWKPPYYGVQEATKSLAELATTFEHEGAHQHLLNFRKHALEKLRSKNKLLDELQIKLIGANANTVSSNPSAMAPLWAEDFTLSGENTCIHLHRVNPQLRVGEFSSQLCGVLQVPGVKLVLKGKTLLVADNDTSIGCLAHGTAKMMCLVQHPEPQKTSDEAMIESIRGAARQLQNTNMLDITDASGNLVSMTNSDRLSFLTALGLHALGRKRLQDMSKESALVFLLECDREWGHLDDSWLSRVDNFGLLQLDICWVYLKLESLENLPNVIQRLERAESVFRKQVHVNFVTLALVQADLGENVPVLCAVFVRLFLLQGVAFYHSGDMEKAKARLDWAWGLAKSLRAVSPPDAVARLCEAVSATPFEAISALRRSNGIINQAAETIEHEQESICNKEEERRRQKQYGLCENGQDFVNLRTMEQIQTALGLTNNDEVAGGLLRLANNDLGRGIDIYQDCYRENATVLSRTRVLDAKQDMSRKRSRVEEDEVESADSNHNGMASTQARTNESSVAQTDVSVDQDTSMATTKDAPARVSQSAHSPSRSPEQDPVKLLKDVLGEALETSHEKEGYLGNALDEEWQYIEQYRGLIA